MKSHTVRLTLNVPARMDFVKITDRGAEALENKIFRWSGRVDLNPLPPDPSQAGVPQDSRIVKGFFEAMRGELPVDPGSTHFRFDHASWIDLGEARQ
jgi:hypothetical protein